MSRPLAGEPTLQNLADAAKGGSTYVKQVSARRLLGAYNPLDADAVTAHETVMATPPTVTFGAASGATALTNVRSYAANATITGGDPVIPPFRAYGGFVKVSGGSNFVSNNLQIIVQSTTPYYVDFRTDAPSFEIKSYGNSNGYYRVRVDGKLVSTAVNTSGSTAASYLDLYAFGTRQMRHIEIEAANGWRFQGVNITTADVIRPSSKKIGPRVVWIGDSFTQGATATSFLTAMVPLTCRTLGWKDVYNCGLSGTGYVTPGNVTGAKKLRDRLQHDVYAYSPEIVVVALGYNDQYFSIAPDTVRAEALLAFQEIKNNLPTCTLIVIGHMAMQIPSAAMSAMDAAITAAVKAAGPLVDLYIRPFGDGTTTNPAWVDNAAQVATYRAGDGIHPNQDGHYLLAQSISDGIRAALPLG